MATVKKEEKTVSVKEEKGKEEKGLNVIDVIFEGWFNSFKSFQFLQNGVEQKSLQVFEELQNGWIQSTRDQLVQLEEESKKLTTEWKEILQEVLKKAGVQNLTDWTAKFEEVGHKAEKLAFSPSKATLDILSKSNTQFDNALKEAIDQQQKNRSEVLDTIGEFVEELKQSQNEVLKNFEQYNPLLTK